MSRPFATSLGIVAVLLWSLLALLTVLTAPVPPFLLNALTFGFGALACLFWMALVGRLHLLRQVPLGVVAFGSAGLFGYHALYFYALRLAPPAEASLVNYLWPLLVVLFAGLLLGERLRRGHIFGALLGFLGAALVIIGGGQGISGFGLGHLLALSAAVVWGLYSVLSRRFGAVPTESVALFCLATSALSFVLHFATEETIWPPGALSWFWVILLGIGPVGPAVFLWDIGMKRGDIRLLGVAGNAAPILTTTLLVLSGRAEFSWLLALSVALISSGALLAIHASRREAAETSAKHGPTFGAE